MNNSISIFRRDLRLEDNSTLIHALQNSSKVLPLLIFDPFQLKPKNSYFSQNAFEFMYESLNALLNPPATALKKDDSPYSIFTPYFNNAKKLPAKSPSKNTLKNYFSSFANS